MEASVTEPHDEVIKWKHFPRNWPFVRGSPVPVNSPHKDQWRINDWVNNGEAGDLRRHRGHYDVNVMYSDSVPTLASAVLTCRPQNHPFRTAM